MKKISRKELEAAQREIRTIRATLDGEANLLCQSHKPRLVMYAMLTEAIRLCPASGFGPDDFLQLTVDAVNLYTGQVDGKPFIAIVEREDD
jgi:hypothetical protein